MIDRDEVMVCVLARIQAEGKDLAQLSESEIGTLIAEAVADLRLAHSVINQQSE